MVDLSDSNLMMIEPTGTIPLTDIDDNLTEMARELWRVCTKSKIGYRGIHVCTCGKCSDNHDYFLPDGTPYKFTVSPLCTTSQI